VESEINDTKRDLTIYLDSIGVFNMSIDTFADLGIITTSHTVFQYKTIISEEHAKSVNSTLAECIKNAMVLNIDNYYSIHTKRMSNITITSIVIHLATILMNSIMMQPAISKINIHNSVLVDAELIKTNIKNRFMKFYDLSHN